MSATTASAPRTRRQLGGSLLGGPALVSLAVALAALSLVLPWALAFDPQMWLVWGRDVTRLTLDTRAGPSWKPGPVLLTAPFALLGGAAPALWLIAARAGALLALAGAWTLACRLAGPWAGAAAAGAIAVSPWWLPNAALGNSEGILAAAVLWAVVAHVAGRRRGAVALGLLAALLRPEVWPFLLLYGVWAWRADPRTRPVLALAAVAVPVLWFGPDLAGAGSGAARAARGTPSEGSARLAEHPVLAVLWDAVKIGGIPVFVAAVAGAAGTGGDVRAALRRPTTWLALGAAGWVAIVAAMTAGGYAGNPRYLVAAAALLAVLAGVGAARLPGAAALVLVAAVGALAFSGLRDDLRDVGVRADRRTALPRLVDAAGGRDALLRCAPVRTAGVVRGLVAWELDVPAYGINAAPRPPAGVLQMRPYEGGRPDPAFDPAGYRRLASAPGWTAWGACRG